tara:strand:- start:262 stop:879 length:618 start_codon:yes stop_codon:yes gene_type:complete
MDYKNFIIRSITSFVLFFLYAFFLYTNHNLILFLIVIFYIFVLFEIVINFTKILIPFVYVTLSLIAFIMYFTLYFDYLYFNFLLLIIISFDVFSYLCGSIFGKNKIFEKISPNKTYEGLILGFILSNICSLIYISYFLEISILNILFINLIICFSFFGDLIESYFKRLSKLKNSSSIIPGHGGFFDRIDSFIFSIYILLLFSIFQ